MNKSQKILKMKKPKQQQMKKSNSKSEPRDVIITVFFEDEMRIYKDLCLYTNMEMLLNSIEFNKKLLEADYSFFDKTYNDTINLTYRPKVSFDDISNCILNYTSCFFGSETFKKLLLERTNEPITLTVYLNIDNNDHSTIEIDHPDQPNYISESDLLLHQKSKLSLSLSSKLQFIDYWEQEFLFKLVELATDQEESFVKWTLDLLKEFLCDLVNEEDIDNGSVCSDLMDILVTLEFYNLISIQNELVNEEGIDEKVYYYIISICDLEVYNKFFQLMESNRAA